MIFASSITYLRPRRLVSQIALLIFVVVVFYQLVIISLFHALEIEGRRHYVSEADYITTALLALDSVESNAREGLIHDIKLATPYANIILSDFAPILEQTNDPVTKAELERIRAHLWPDANVYITHQEDGDSYGAFALQMRKGNYARVSITQYRKPDRLLWRWASEPEPDMPIFLTRWARMGFMFILSASVLIVWASGTIVRPLVNLANETEHFPHEHRVNLPVSPYASVEIINLAKSFDRMQERIIEMIRSQKLMIAALSHDLRSVTTRLSLRAEFIQNGEMKSKLQSDIKIMESMLSKTLQYFKSEHSEGEYSTLDVDSILQTVSDEFRDLGYSVSYLGGAHYHICGSLNEMMRVFTNLVENAARYGTHVSIILERPSVSAICISVIDDGPGIDPNDLCNVFEPFVRGNIGRTLQEPNGFGLGLAIVRSIVKKHTGHVEILNRQPHGVIVRVTLPLINHKSASSGSN